MGLLIRGLELHIKGEQFQLNLSLDEQIRRIGPLKDAADFPILQPVYEFINVNAKTSFKGIKGL